MTTFSQLLAGLQATDPSLPLVFQTKQGAIGAGYHVTELRHSHSKGIDCGGNIQSWQEARLQLLDGYGGEHMSVGKFSSIVAKSMAAVPELEQADLLVEFGHSNSDLSLLAIREPEVKDDAVIVFLGDAHAVCKPAQIAISDDQLDGSCCGGEQESRSGNSCCSASDPMTGEKTCCA